MYCSKCGTLIKDGYKFCSKCGTKVVKASSTKEALTTSGEKVVDEQQPQKELSIEVSKYITDTKDLIQKAEQGEVEAQLQLAFRYENGIGVSVSTEKAEALYKEVESKGISRDYLSERMFVDCDVFEKSGVVSDLITLTTEPFREASDFYDFIDVQVSPQHPEFQTLVSLVTQYNKNAQKAGYQKLYLDTSNGSISGWFGEEFKKGFWAKLFCPVSDRSMEKTFDQIIILLESMGA